MSLELSLFCVRTENDEMEVIRSVILTRDNEAFFDPEGKFPSTFWVLTKLFATQIRTIDGVVDVVKSESKSLREDLILKKYTETIEYLRLSEEFHAKDLVFATAKAMTSIATIWDQVKDENVRNILIGGVVAKFKGHTASPDSLAPKTATETKC